MSAFMVFIDATNRNRMLNIALFNRVHDDEASSYTLLLCFSSFIDFYILTGQVKF